MAPELVEQLHREIQVRVGRGRSNLGQICWLTGGPAGVQGRQETDKIGTHSPAVREPLRTPRPLGQSSRFNSRAQSLIGFFDLDPNRVLDLVLDAAEAAAPNCQAFLPLVTRFKKDAVVHLLGFKFQHAQVIPLCLLYD